MDGVERGRQTVHSNYSQKYFILASVVVDMVEICVSRVTLHTHFHTSTGHFSEHAKQHTDSSAVSNCPQ